VSSPDELTPEAKEIDANIASFKEDERIAVASLALTAREMIEEEGYLLECVLRSTARLAFDAGGVAMLEAAKTTERERVLKRLREERKDRKERP
jgi:hypothetical protein